MDLERGRRLSVPAARSRRATVSGARKPERAACGRRVRWTIASGDRAMERRLARETPPRVGVGRCPEDRSLDRALSFGHRDLADHAARSVLQRQHGPGYRGGRTAGGTGWGLI